MRALRVAQRLRYLAAVLLLLGGAQTAAHEAEHGDDEHEHFGVTCAVAIADEVSGASAPPRFVRLSSRRHPLRRAGATRPANGRPRDTLPPPTGPPLHLH